ncbi:hypothetical protein H2248_003806 [Termitomyces sp. 'cryptogamus']|nr:hypothetical protein H2248_003806 [Termitomyces sp. 'cryptogamus']
MKKSNVKPLKAKIRVATACNLYLLKYLVSHLDATKGDFATTCKASNTQTKEI